MTLYSSKLLRISSCCLFSRFHQDGGFDLLVMHGLNLVYPVSESSGYGQTIISHHTPPDFKDEVFSLEVYTPRLLVHSWVSNQYPLDRLYRRWPVNTDDYQCQALARQITILFLTIHQVINRRFSTGSSSWALFNSGQHPAPKLVRT
jgi:hypothetical protein